MKKPKFKVYKNDMDQVTIWEVVDRYTGLQWCFSYVYPRALAICRVLNKEEDK